MSNREPVLKTLAGIPLVHMWWAVPLALAVWTAALFLTPLAWLWVKFVDKFIA